MGEAYVINSSHIWQLKKLNVFILPNQPTYIVCKFETKDKQYGIIFLL
jgi:hypothetical protein